MGYTDCMPEYTIYNSDDPDGSLALAAHQASKKVERIEELKRMITTMQSELATLSA